MSKLPRAVLVSKGRAAFTGMNKKIFHVEIENGFLDAFISSGHGTLLAKIEVWKIKEGKKIRRELRPSKKLKPE